MLRLRPTEIQLQPSEVAATRRNLDARRNTLNARARAMMHRTFHDSSQDTVMLKARSGPQHSRDESLSDANHVLNRAHMVSYDQVDDSDKCLVDEETTDSFDSSLLLQQDISFARRPSCFDGNSMRSVAETDKNGGGHDSGNASLIQDMGKAQALLPFSLPVRARVRPRSSSDPLSSLDDTSSSQDDTFSEGNTDRRPARLSQPPPSERPPQLRICSVASSGKTSIQQDEVARASSPSAILEAVGGMVSPLDALQTSVASESNDTMDHRQNEIGVPATDETASQSSSNVASSSRERSDSEVSSYLPTLSRQNAVRLTPARRRRYARTAYTERHLQPNYAALRAERPSSEGSPAPRSTRHLPYPNQENLDESERLVEARRVWMTRGSTEGVLDQTPPPEGRFERYV